MVNEIQRRGRIAGLDLFERARERVPLDLAGMKSEALGGLGDISIAELLAREARYRFFFHPIRYTSLGLALLEAMAIGMPIVAPATTEVPTVLRDGEEGFISANPGYLIDGMRALLADPAEARRMGENARRVARERFSIERFARDWSEVFQRVAS